MESRRLWPDPYMAPDVPPHEELEAFLRNPQEPDKAWLKAQIEERVNCRRAVEERHLMKTLGFSGADVQKVPHPLPAILTSTKTALRSAPLPFDTHSGKDETVAKAVGQIWAMTHDVWVRDSKRRLAQRRSWEPQFALLVEGPHDVSGITVWRAVPCSIEGTWSYDHFANDEIEVTTQKNGDWIAHLWAEHPVADSIKPQLTRSVATLDEASLENLAVARSAIAEGLSLGIDERSGMLLNQNDDAEVLLARERLLFGVSWRVSTVDSLAPEVAICAH